MLRPAQLQIGRRPPVGTNGETSVGIAVSGISYNHKHSGLALPGRAIAFVFGAMILLLGAFAFPRSAPAPEPVARKGPALVVLAPGAIPFVKTVQPIIISRDAESRDPIAQEISSSNSSPISPPVPMPRPRPKRL